MSQTPVRVLVVDDSAFARKVVREVLSGDDNIEVVGIARDGLDALEKIAELAPDVVTLDLVMPSLDGVGMLRALQGTAKPPSIVVVSMNDGDSELGVEALTLGAFDVVKKPTALATDMLYELQDELREKVRAAAGSRHALEKPRAVKVPLAAPAASVRLVVVGASTGGPHAVSVLLRGLPASFGVPIVVVLHLPAGYTEAFAKRLDQEGAIRVVEAQDGMRLEPNRVIIARAGSHLTFEASGANAIIRLVLEPLSTPHRPSVDVTFGSAAACLGSEVLGVVLTGMGNDGVNGSRAITQAGGRVLTEGESSCVVYGMPRAVSEAGLSAGEAPIDAMAALIASNV